MINNILIEIDTSKKVFLISSNELGEIKNDSRLSFSLKNLGGDYIDKHIVIPYEEKESMKILQNIQKCFERFGYTLELAEKIQELYSSFVLEQQEFKKFAENAEKIRNNKFDSNPDLVKAFENFQEVLKNNMDRNLYPLQLLSSFHLAFSQNACNFAVPGAGKTSIVYGAYTYLKNLPPEDERHVDYLFVVGPISSFKPWEKEYNKCFGRKIKSQRLDGSITRDEKIQYLHSNNPSELTLIWHGGVPSLCNEILDFLKRNKTMVVIDEAHRIKNHEGLWGTNAVEIAKEAKSRVILTGTPVPNGYEDIYNLYKFIYPYKFKEILKVNYINLQDMTSNSDIESDRVKTFTDNISPFFIRIKKKDLNLPPAYDTTMRVEMSPIQREIYNFIEEKYVLSFKKDSSATIKDILNRAKLIRLRQAAINPSLLKKTIFETLENPEENDTYSWVSKLKSLEIVDEFQNDPEILEKISNYSKIEIPKKFEKTMEIVKKLITNGEKVIIWTIFIQNAKELQEYFSRNQIKSKLLIGQVEAIEREIIIEKFNDSRNFEFSVVIANPFSVSESISLHEGCHNAIYIERDYNCANFLQSKNRIHRYGLPQDQDTNYFYIISLNSIDEIINNKLDEKVKRMEKIIDQDVPLFARLNDEDETDLITELIKRYEGK